mmetsp:Transcript_37080/g.95760  ORF Transcript_37080/g.95760 Transcript_37080/m.95760 type:complete len:215 (+) Transcript_37080:683-1327(+)
MSMATASSSFWSRLCSSKSLTPRLILTEGSRATMPEPVQGASRSTRSSFGNIPISFLPSRLVTTTLVRPMRCTLATSALHRSLLRSLAKSVPVLCISWPMCVVLPPGAAAMSRMTSFCCGASAMTGTKDDALWIMYWPPRYSGVAPMGTADSYTFSPTLVQLPMASTCTFRAMRACIRELRRALSELVRIVKGRCFSLASKNSTAVSALNIPRK